MSEPIPEETSELEEIQRGREAAYLLEHPMITGALHALEQYYNDAWRNTTLEQVDEREEAFRMLLMANAFRMLLTKYVETGTLSETKAAHDELQRKLAEEA